MSPQDTFTDLLKTNHQSRTKARQEVFDVLCAQSEPIGMRDLVTLSKGVDRASVYRAVELFEQLGIVQRLYAGWKYKLELSDRFAAHHHHLTCLRCGKSGAISEEDLERFIDTVAARHGFKASAHQVEIQGICRNCQAAEARGIV